MPNPEEPHVPQPDPEAELPQNIKDHLGHLKQYRDAFRDGTMTTWTAAEWRSNTAHALADLIDWIRMNETRG